MSNSMVLLLGVGVIGVLGFVLFGGLGASASGTGFGCGGLQTQGCSIEGVTNQGAVDSASGAGGVGAGAPAGVPAGGVQDVYVKALGTGLYDNQVVRVQAGRPVRFHFSAAPDSGCGRILIMRDFGVRLVSKSGEEQVAEFTPQKGTYEFSCSMRMFIGRLEAV